MQLHKDFGPIISRKSSIKWLVNVERSSTYVAVVELFFVSNLQQRCVASNLPLQLNWGCWGKPPWRYFWPPQPPIDAVKLNYSKKPNFFLISNRTNISSNSKFPPIVFKLSFVLRCFEQKIYTYKNSYVTATALVSIL